MKQDSKKKKKEKKEEEEEEEEKMIIIRRIIIEGSLETKVSTIWTDEKHSQEEAEQGRNSNLEKVRR